MHGIERDLGRPVYGLADDMFKKVPLVGTCLVSPRRRAGPPRQRLPAAARAAAPRAGLPRGVEGARQDLRRALPAPPLRPGRLRPDRHAGRRAGRPDRRRRQPRSPCPSLVKVTALDRLLGVPYVPITANMLAFGPLGLLCPSRPSSSIRVLDPVDFDVPPDQPATRAADHGRVRGHPPRHPGGALRHAPPPPQRLVRADGPRVLVTGLSTFWGGRVAQALEATRRSTSTSSSARHRGAHGRLERTEYVRADESYSILVASCRHRRSTRSMHTFLVVDSHRRCGRADARDQRHRHDEPVRRGVSARGRRCATSW